MSNLANTPLYTPTSTLGPYRYDDYLNLPVGSRFELIRGWLTPWNQPTADVRIPCNAAHVTAKFVVSRWIEWMRDQRRVAGLAELNRRQLVIEVKSPARPRARMQRLRRYPQLCVEEYWFIDPVERCILFYVLEAGQYAVHTGVDNRYQSVRFPEVEIDLASFWAEVSERLPSVVSLHSI